MLCGFIRNSAFRAFSEWKATLTEYVLTFVIRRLYPSHSAACKSVSLQDIDSRLHGGWHELRFGVNEALVAPTADDGGQAGQ